MLLRRCLTLLLPAVVLVASGCGGTDIKVAKSDPVHRGAEIFNQRCGGCHTIDAASTEGSASHIQTREYKDGPNFNQRREQYQDVIYAIQNGGFSSGPMPQNIVVGKEAKQVACFIAEFSGKDAKQAPAPASSKAQGQTTNCRPEINK